MVTWHGRASSQNKNKIGMDGYGRPPSGTRPGQIFARPKSNFQILPVQMTGGRVSG